MSTPKGKSQDSDIEDIMSEIEELQKEMKSPSDASASPSGAKHLHVVASNAPGTADSGSLSPEEEEDILKEFQAVGGGGGGSEGGGLEDTLADCRAEDTGKGILDQAISASSEETQESEPVSETVHEEPVHEEVVEETHSATEEEETMSDHDQGGDENGSLSMTLQGNMTLKLKYETEGQEVWIGFAEGSLSVKLADGTEFKIPVRRGAGGKNTKVRKIA